MSEIEYLERVIQDPEGVKTDEIADFLGRTSSSVSTQIGRLKAEKFPEELGKQFNGWKQSEINFLKGAAGKIPYTEIAQELNKTVAAVYHKARDLGIKISNPAIQYSEIKKYATGEYTAKEIASKLGTSYSAEQVRKYCWRHPELKIKNTQELSETKNERKGMGKMPILQKDFFKLANVTQHSQFQKFLEDIVLDKEKREEFYRGCIHIDPQCVEHDTFRQYFEEFAAERKSNQQDFTPESITQLMATLTDVPVSQSYGWTAYDCAAGTGAMILSKWKKERNKHLPWDYRPHNYLYLCEELSDITIPYLIHNLALRGMNAVVIHGDTLEQTANQAYFIQNANDNPLGFSSVNVLPHSKAVQEFLSIKEWTADQIDHIEDELSDIVWRPLPNEQPIPFTLKGDK